MAPEVYVPHKGPIAEYLENEDAVTLPDFSELPLKSAPTAGHYLPN